MILAVFLFSLRASGMTEIVFWPCVSLRSGNPTDANSPKSLRMGLESWYMTKNTRSSRAS